MVIFIGPGSVQEYKDGQIKSVQPIELNEPRRRVYKWNENKGILTLNEDIFPKGELEKFMEEYNGKIGFVNSQGRKFEFYEVKKNRIFFT